MSLIDFLASAAITLFVIIDPVGLCPIFLGLTDGASAETRKRIAVRSVLIAFIILCFFVIIGKPFLNALGITLPAFRIAGGLLLFSIGYEMVFEKRTKRKKRSAQAAISDDDVHNIAAFPLAIPLMAGPGSITAVILLSTQAQGDPLSLAALFLLIALMLALCFLFFMAAGYIDRMLGTTGRLVLGRLLGVLLSALAVQFIADGILAFARTL